MKGFQAFKRFPKWNVQSSELPKIEVETTFEYVSPTNERASDALDLDKKISVKTPLSVRWKDDGSFKEDASVKEDDIIKPSDVESTCIDSWDYDPITLDLDVYFVSNPSKAYRFPGIPKSVIKRWITAPSKGQFYQRVIRGYSTI